MLVTILFTVIACEKPTTPGDNTPMASRFYVLDITEGTPRAGLTPPDVESYQQTTEYACGAAAVVTLLRHYGRTGDEMMLAGEMGTSSTCGTPPAQMAIWRPDTVENRGDYAVTGITKFIKLINAFSDTIQIGLSVDDSETFWKLATNVGDTVRPFDSTLCYYNCYSLSAVFSDWEPAAGIFDNPLNFIQPDSLNWMSDSTFGGTFYIEPRDSIYLWLRIGTPPWYSIGDEVIKLRISHRIRTE